LSTYTANKYGDSTPPCRIPRVNWKKHDVTVMISIFYNTVLNASVEDRSFKTTNKHQTLLYCFVVNFSFVIPKFKFKFCDHQVPAAQLFICIQYAVQTNIDHSQMLRLGLMIKGYRCYTLYTRILKYMFSNCIRCWLSLVLSKTLQR